MTLFIQRLAFLLLFPALCLISLGAKSNVVDSKAELHRLMDQAWEFLLQSSPDDASLLGEKRWNSEWPNVSLTAIQERYDFYRSVLKRLSMIDPHQLDDEDRLNYDLMKRNYQIRLEAEKFDFELLPISHRSGMHKAAEMTVELPFKSKKDFENWITRLKKYSIYMDQTIDLMREGKKKHLLFPKVIQERISKQLTVQVNTQAEDTLFYSPFLNMPSYLSSSERQSLRAEAKDAIEAHVVPAFRKLQKFFDHEYFPAAPLGIAENIGATSFPNGKERYAYAIRRYTTTDLTAEQIHQIGLDEVARIKNQMNSILEKVGFRGSLSEFMKSLKSESKFYSNNPEELLEGYRKIIKDLESQLPKLFKRFPKASLQVVQVPEASAPDAVGAYYSSPAQDGSKPGFFYVNLYKVETRAKFEMATLALHEAIPGHHFQISFAQEIEGLHEFRKESDFTAFIEGWGLYAESLGDELGLFDDPYAKFGQLTMEMFRACRLVVDTGIHHYGWTRQRAIDYMVENINRPLGYIENEVDRYIVNPGQALAYKIGQLKIQELRDRATKALGSKFDIREFHDVVLREGALPLDILERRVDDWIKTKN